MSEPVRPSDSRERKPSRATAETRRKSDEAHQSSFSPVEIEAPRSPLLFAALWFGLPILVVILIETLHLFGH